MEITIGTPSDIDGILALLPQVYRIGSLPPNAEKILVDLLAADYCNILVAKVESQLAGCAFLFYIPIPAHGQPYTLLEGLVVDQDHRKHGLGTALFEKAEELARHRNCYKIIFTTGVDRPEAQKFYEKLGFKKWGVEFRKDL